MSKRMRDPDNEDIKVILQALDLIKELVESMLTERDLLDINKQIVKFPEASTSRARPSNQDRITKLQQLRNKFLENVELSKLNSAARGAYLPTKKIIELDPNVEYKVTELKKVAGRWGPAIVATIAEEFTVFLPARISKMLLNDTSLMQHLNGLIANEQLILKYLGNGTECEFKFL